MKKEKKEIRKALPAVREKSCKKKHEPTTSVSDYALTKLIDCVASTVQSNSKLRAEVKAEREKAEAEISVLREKERVQSKTVTIGDISFSTEIFGDKAKFIVPALIAVSGVSALATAFVEAKKDDL